VIAHAAANGIASAGILFLQADAAANPLLGPTPVGLIASLPWAILAAYLFWKGAPEEGSKGVERQVSRET